jgi:hypothetical protein
LLDERHDALAAQGVPRFRIAEETRHGDEEVAEERLDLVGVLAQVGEVVVDRRAVLQLHAPHEPPHDGGALVAREVVARARSQELEQALQRELAVFVDGEARVRRADQGKELLAVTCEVCEPRRELLHREDDIRHARRDHGPRHGIVQGFLGVLHEDHAAGLLHGARAEGTVRAAAGQDHDEAIAVLGERAEEDVDGRALTARLGERHGRDRARRELELVARRDQVDTVGPQRMPRMLECHDRHRRALCEYRRQLALVRRRQMQHDDVCQAKIGRQCMEEVAQRLDTAGRGADADRRDSRRRRPLAVAVLRCPLVRVGVGIAGHAESRFGTSGRAFR